MDSFRTEMHPDPWTGGDQLGWRSFLLDLLQTLILAVVLFLVINFVSARIRVESISMLETLHPGDFVLVSRLAYRSELPDRGDVVVFDPPVLSEEPYIKRVIGLPGDELKIDAGQLYVNGVLFAEPYINGRFMTSGSWRVPADSLFVMGDNRNSSSDSRAWGTVPLENLIGKAVFIYWPPTQWGGLSPGAMAVEP